ncbi:hypothetical protein SCHPADRAFT_63910 [Schizopora paradoxa]|uniref:MYND-type domain-containing protein n=1 Tax=Schizopora paradoxa TaxID=27342 RepID=A0A0H2SCM0_9AGAM|nr:hypothetical protein SCHPADRAFT_63910 [Schizopora paradoxa]
MACFKCFDMPGQPVQVLPCSRCKRVSYCDIECQREDFEEHKYFCKAISSVDRAAKPLPNFRGPYTTEGLLDKSVEQCSETCAAVEEILGRKLSHKERSLIIYEPRCGVCFRTERDLRAATKYEAVRQRLDVTRKLKRCQDCSNLFCCSEPHGHMTLPDHEDSDVPGSKCSILRKMMTDDRVALRFTLNDEELLGPITWVPARRKIRITPLLSNLTPASSPPWERWFADPSTMFPFDVMDLELTTMRMLTKSLSLPLTILNAIQHFDNIPTVASPPLSQPGPSAPCRPGLLLAERSSLEIHIIGATAYDIFGGGGYVYEELLHSLPACTRLTLRFIGPALREINTFGRRQEEEYAVQNCGDCRARGIERIHGLHPQLYHDWLPMTREAIRAQDLRAALPDLAVIFNGSFIDKEDRASWVPTLLILSEYGVPTVVTDVSEVYGQTSQIMAKVCRGKIVVPLQKNPWRNECGTPEPCGSRGFLYQNDVFFCFRGSTV